MKKNDSNMLKLQTEVTFDRSEVTFSYSDRILLLGSCFSDSIGQKMIDASFDVMTNPFGTLYNPLSLSNALARLSSGVPFTLEECVEMGAGAGLVCSFSHHTSFARKTREEFLEAANSSLAKASSFFRSCNKIILTFGTSYYYDHISFGPVSNCLKRNASEFRRERLSLQATSSVLGRMVEKFSKDSSECVPKQFIFTVSPIRHLSDTAHGNQLSKSSLLLAVDSVVGKNPGICSYFPSYEIMMDELRDYRFYAEDMVHPSSQAVDYIWERFLSFALAEGEVEKVKENERLFRRNAHRPLHR